MFDRLIKIQVDFGFKIIRKQAHIEDFLFRRFSEISVPTNARWLSFQFVFYFK